MSQFRSFRDMPDLPRALANTTCKGNTDSVCQRAALGMTPKKKWGYDRTAKLRSNGNPSYDLVTLVSVHVRNRDLHYSYIE